MPPLLLSLQLIMSVCLMAERHGQRLNSEGLLRVDFVHIGGTLTTLHKIHNGCCTTNWTKLCKHTIPKAPSALMCLGCARIPSQQARCKRSQQPAFLPAHSPACYPCVKPHVWAPYHHIPSPFPLTFHPSLCLQNSTIKAYAVSLLRFMVYGLQLGFRLLHHTKQLGPLPFIWHAVICNTCLQGLRATVPHHIKLHKNQTKGSPSLASQPSLFTISLLHTPVSIKDMGGCMSHKVQKHCIQGICPLLRPQPLSCGRSLLAVDCNSCVLVQAVHDQPQPAQG